MSDSSSEALAEIYLRQSGDQDDREYIACLCTRVLVKNQTEAVAIEQEELSEAYDIFNEQYCDNHVAMNRKEHSQEEEDSDANSCYYSASASHTDNYCTTDEHERDSGADISEYHGASTSREIFKRSHRDDGGKSSSTSVERDLTGCLTDIIEERDAKEQWEKFWSENCERLIWTSWIANYSDFISPEYQNVQPGDDNLTPNNTEEVQTGDSADGDQTGDNFDGAKTDQQAKNNTKQPVSEETSPETEQKEINRELYISAEEMPLVGNCETAIVISTCSPTATDSKAINDSNDDTRLKEMMDNLGLPRCDSVSSSIPLTLNTTDSMTNVTQISLSSYGFCSSGITSSENSQLSESTPSSLSPPFNFEEDDQTKMQSVNDGDSSDQQWQLLWQEHYQDQYNKHYAQFIAERTKTGATKASEPDDDEYEITDLKQLAEMGLPTSFGPKFNKTKRSQRQSEDPDRVRAAFTLMGYSFFNNNSEDTSGHVIYRKRNIRLHNNMLKMKKKRIDLDSSARDEALLDLIADSSSDETDKPVPSVTLPKLDSPEQNSETINVVDSGRVDGVTHKPIEVDNEASKCDIGVENEATVTKSSSKKSKKKRRQNKMLAGMPAEIASDRTLYKYWCKRFSLFSLFDLGIKLDRESWFSVTPEKVAIYTAMRCQSDVIVDAFCGAGGNTIQFAKTCQRVIAIDIDEKKIEMAKHNASIYGVADRIEFIVGDYFALASTLKADVVFLSPPWGGPQYLKEDVYDIEKLLLPRPASQLMACTRQITPNIAIYVPRNTNTFDLAKLAGPGQSVEIEQGFLDRKLIAITAFYGNLLKKAQA